MGGDSTRSKAVDGYKLVESFFDFIEVRLYDHPDRYVLKDMDYWIWSEKNQELQKYHTNEGLTWEMLKPYFENKLLYIWKE